MHDYDYDDGPGVPHVNIGAELHVNAPTLDLNASVGGGRTLADLIVRSALDRLVKDDPWSTVEDRVQRIRDEEIRDHVKAVIAEVLEGDLRRTNSFGEPVGKPTTLRELIVEEARQILIRRDDSYPRNGETVIGKLVREQVEVAFKKELSGVIAEEKAKVVAAVRESAADLIAKAVTEGIGGAR